MKRAQKNLVRDQKLKVQANRVLLLITHCVIVVHLMNTASLNQTHKLNNFGSQWYLNGRPLGTTSCWHGFESCHIWDPQRHLWVI